MRKFTLLASVALSPWALMAEAQETQSVKFTIEEIVVTAQKRSESMQDVPVAVNALSAEYLQTNNVRTIEDLAAATPGLVTTNNIGNGSAPISIRGIGGANGGGNIFADEPVAVYVNEVFVGRPRIAAADLLDVSNIQVLRGPQGTLYGRNSTAGALLLTTALPTPELEAFVSASAATHAEYRVSGAVSGPLNQGATILARVAGGYTNRNGWARNSFNGERIGGSESETARLSLRFLPTDDLSIDLIGEYSNQVDRPATVAISDISHLRDQNTNPGGDNRVFPFTPRADLQAVIDDKLFAHNVPFKSDTEGQNFTAKVEWDLGGVVLDSVTGWRRWTSDGTQDSDGTAIDPPTPFVVVGDVTTIGDNFGNFEDREWSQELRLSSDNDGRFGWITGLYYYHADNAIKPIVIDSGLAGPGSNAATGAAGTGTSIAFNARQGTNAYSIFADANYELIDDLTLTVGGRYSYEKKKFTNRNIVTTILAFDPPGPPNPLFPAGFTLFDSGSVAFEDSWNDFSPRAVLRYRFNDDVMSYASFSKAFKSGGFNAFGVAPSFKPENIDAYEAGFKSDLLDGMARFNASLYLYNYSDLQVRTPIPTGGVGIETADQARVKGFEVEGSLLPFEGFRIDANAAYADGNFRQGSLSAVTVDSFVLGTTITTGPEDIAGNRLTRAPKWQTNVSASYRYPLSDSLELKGQVMDRYQSAVFFLETRQDASTFRSDGWNEIDARITLADRDGRWDVAIYGENLSNDRHLTQVTAFFGLPNATPNETRKFGIQLNARY